MQEVDAERRIQILRGLPVSAPPAPLEEQEENGQVKHNREDRPHRERKRRRIAGEDDTERDIRFAREDHALAPAKPPLQMKPTSNNKKSSSAPLTDANGHINLFPMDGTQHRAPDKNAEREAEKAKRKKEFEDQYTMRFSNAAGFKQDVGEKPWYQQTGLPKGDGDIDAGDVQAPLMKDVWGNDDPRRQERAKLKAAAEDPLAAMRKGVTGLREAEREKKRWKEERDREIRELEGEERRRERRRKKRRRRGGSQDEGDELEGFSLEGDDGAGADDRTRRRQHHHGHRHRHEGSRDRSRHRSQRPRHRPVVVDSRTG